MDLLSPCKRTGVAGGEPDRDVLDIFERHNIMPLIDKIRKAFIECGWTCEYDEKENPNLEIVSNEEIGRICLLCICDLLTKDGITNETFTKESLILAINERIK
jgi:hypothetical protein